MTSRTIAHKFFPLVTAQLLGAFNDNLFKMVVSMAAVTHGLEAASASGYLSLVGTIFILPYIFFSGIAGRVVDVAGKRRVLIVSKACEFIIMVFALIALIIGDIWALLSTLFLLALQATFFSPAKYGILPEILPRQRLFWANGILELSRYLAVIAGTTIGAIAYAIWQESPGRIGGLLLVVATLGTVAILFVGEGERRPAMAKSCRENWFSVACYGTIRGVRRLARDPVLGPASFGLAYFEFLGTLLLFLLLLLGKVEMGWSDLQVAVLAVLVGSGVASGSFVIGYCTNSRVEIGLVPVGGIGLSFAASMVGYVNEEYTQVLFWTFVAGFFGGFVIVPWNSLLQRYARPEERGSIIATTNFLCMNGVLIASGVLWILCDLLALQQNHLLLALGIFTFMLTTFLMVMRREYRRRSYRWFCWVLPRLLHRA